MKRKYSLLFISGLLVSGAILLISCGKQHASGKLIVTETKSAPQAMNLSTGADWRYLSEAKLVAVDPDRPSDASEVLTADFFSAVAPDIAPDGSSMVFAAQQKQGDPWQIWEMKLSGTISRKVIDLPENCTDPVYLPNGSIAFSRSMTGDSLGAGHTLFTCQRDGSALTRITFHPGADFAATILNDGRLLAISRQLAPEETDPMLYVIRPDGTKGDLYYRDAPGTRLISKARESAEGMVYFVESGAGSLKGQLVSISQNRPLHSKKTRAVDGTGDFCSVFPQVSGKLLVTCRNSPTEPYALYAYDLKEGLSDKPVYRATDAQIVDAVAVETRVRARKLPSEVDTGVKTGLLMCQDINYLDMAAVLSGQPKIKATKIEILGPKESYGIVDVAADGSFYLKVMADTPIRIQTLDEKGNVINGPCAPIWLRPNERRGCVGCHEDHEMAPENRIALAVGKAPVALPVHVENIKEKEIELE
jgi:hypothetical protein